MKTTLRSFSALLAALLMFTFTSCGETENPDTPATDSPETQETTPAETEPAYPELEVRSLDGRAINILIRSEWSYEFMVDEQTGDTVSDAIFTRNRKVEDDYNCKLNFIDFAGNWANHDAFTNVIHNSVLASDGEYDFIAGYQAVLTTNIMNGDLMNLYDVDHLTLDAPWWLQEGVEAISYNGKCFEVGGDIAVSVLKGIQCMYFNKRVAAEFSAPNFYELVENGEWTHAKMLEVTKDVYRDLDADGTKSQGDMFGYGAYKYALRNYIVTYDTPTIKDGVCVWNTEHTVDVLEKLVDQYNSSDVFVFKTWADAEQSFSNGNLLLTADSLGTAETLRAMEDDFGIIPYPKYDEKQDKYMTTTSNEVSMMCVPITAPDVEISGLILEAMCRASTDTVAAGFYDVALQGKYARDEKSLEMIELIRSSVTFDLGWIASMATDVSGARYETMVTEGDKGFATWYASAEESINSKIAEYLSKYED